MLTTNRVCNVGQQSNKLGALVIWISPWNEIEILFQQEYSLMIPVQFFIILCYFSKRNTSSNEFVECVCGSFAFIKPNVFFINPKIFFIIFLYRENYQNSSDWEEVHGDRRTRRQATFDHRWYAWI